MPDRDYNRAYALFEQSLGDTSYPVPPVPSVQTYRLSFSPSTRSKCFAERSRLSSGSSSSNPQSPCVETHLLPPTPPGVQPHDPSFGLANRLTTPELTPDTRHGTPFTNLEAPTPKTTPPNLGSFPAHKAPRGLSYDSSRAESFRTAQEATSPHTDADSPIDLPLQGAKKHDSSTEARIEVYALGLEHFDRVTEKAHRKLLKDVHLKRLSKDDVETLASTVSSKSGSTRKRRRISKAPKELTFLEDPGDHALQSPTNQESPSSWLDASSTGNNSPVSPKEQDGNEGGSARPQTPESKIISPSSDGSPVVEASIVDNPYHRQHQLRHVRKNAELRASPPDGKVHDILGVAADRANQQTSQQGGSPTVEHAFHNTFHRPVSRTKAHPEHFNATSPTSRTRSLLSPRMPASLRSKWRRSAPGLMVRETSGSLARVTMEAVPEDKPLPESPQPAVDLGVPESALTSRRRSSDHSAPPSERSLARLSVDRYMERESSRNTHARSSPVSDASEALVRDATAVEIYPHHNESLLVVENPGSSSNASKETTTVLSQGTSHSKELPAEQSTPAKNVQNRAAVESPLTNPRRPPIPPVSVIPPTPVKSERVDEVSPSSPLSKVSSPFRQLSLSKRAKRYSDSLTTSVSKFASASRGVDRSQSARSSAAYPQQQDSSLEEPAAEPSRNLLHPTWRTRSVLNDTDINMVASPLNTKDTVMDADVTGTDSTVENTLPEPVALETSKPQRRLSLRRIWSLKPPSGKGSGNGDMRVASDPAGPDHTAGIQDGAAIGSQRRGLAQGLRERLREYSIRKEEQRHRQRQEKIRHSIGTRFYVEHGAGAAGV